MNTAAETRLTLIYTCSCGARVQALGADVISAPSCAECFKPMAVER